MRRSFFEKFTFLCGFLICLQPNATALGSPKVVSCSSLTFSNPSSQGDIFLLEEIEQKIQALVSAADSRNIKRVYRGFALENYRAVNLLRYIFGDWSQAIASHNFTLLQNQFRDSKMSIDRATLKAAEVVFNEVESGIKELGFVEYAFDQSRRTQIGIPIDKKRSTAMASFFQTPFPRRGADWITAFSYARTGLRGLGGPNKTRQLYENSSMLVIEVDQTKPTGIRGDSEYYLLSHIPPTLIRRFFVGFSNFSRILEGQPYQEQWFEFVIDRDANQNPTGVRVRKVVSNLVGLFDETPEKWTFTREIWNALKQKDRASERFAGNYPELAAELAFLKRVFSQPD